MTATASKVHFGLKNLTIWFASGDTYETKTTIPGVVGYNSTAQVTKTKFYADDVTFYVVNDDKGDEAELETAGIPKAVLARMLGWTVDDNGALVRTVDGTPEHFAMAFQVSGDTDKRGKVNYDCCASVPDESNATLGENVDVQTQTIKLDIIPKTIGGMKAVSAVLDESDDDTAWAAFFTTPYVPTVTPAVVNNDTHI